MKPLNVHIALLGRSKEPILKGFQFYAVDKMYILHSANTPDFPYATTAVEVKDTMRMAGCRGVELELINPFDLYDVINSIVKIREKEREAHILINITGGTNLMAGAACSASFFVGARAYYVMDEKHFPAGVSLGNLVVEMPTPKIPYAKDLNQAQLMVLKATLDLGGTTSSAQLRHMLPMSPQKLSYNLKILEQSGLIITAKGVQRRDLKGDWIDRRCMTVTLTQYGRLFGLWA
jgi:DNA-binding MarR family transcriptional regulator